MPGLPESGPVAIATNRRVGFWASAVAAALGLLYLAVGVTGVLMRPPGLTRFAQVDPYLAVLEAIIILFAIAWTMVVAIVQAAAPPERKAAATIALALTTAFALLTSATHFLNLSLGRQLRDQWLARQLAFEWPSVNLALDLLAWDFFLGLALLFAASALEARRSGKMLSRVARLAGLLCLLGTLAPLTGLMQIQLLAIAGYALVLPLLCLLLARAFAAAGERG